MSLWKKPKTKHQNKQNTKKKPYTLLLNMLLQQPEVKKLKFEQFKRVTFVSFLFLHIFLFYSILRLHLAFLSEMIKLKQLFICNILYEIAEEVYVYSTRKISLPSPISVYCIWLELVKTHLISSLLTFKNQRSDACGEKYNF